jgi:hypothetical protein
VSEASAHAPGGAPAGVTSRHGRPSRLAGALALALVLAGTAFATAHAAFATFAGYDDEGYLLISLRSFMGGGRLYDDVYTQYGPVYYLLQAALHRLTGLPVSNSVARVTCVAVLTLVALGAAVLARRLSGRWSSAAVAATATHFVLLKLVLEPGHPQELCLLLVTAILLAIALLSRRGEAAPWATAGALTSALCLVKPNIGVLAAVALVTAAAWHAPRRGLPRLLAPAAAALALGLPLAMAARVGAGSPAGATGEDGVWLSLAGAVSAALVAILVVAARLRPAGPQALAPLVSLLLGGGGAAAALAAASVWLCTSPAGLWRGLVGQHFSFTTRSWEPPALLPWTALLALAGATAASLWARAPETPRAARRWLLVKLAAAVTLLLPVVLAGLRASTRPLLSGLEDTGGAGPLVSLGAALAWLLLVPGERDWTPGQWQSRLLLALVAAIQPLGAFPVAGGQLAVGAVWLAVVAAVLLGDACDLGPENGRARRSLAAVPVALSLLSVSWTGVARWQYREGLTPLDLPGTAGMRLPAGQVALLRWAAAELARRADTFVGFPQARNSLYLWTGLEPPTALNATYWPLMLDRAQQQRVVAALERHPRAAVLWENSGDPGGSTFAGPGYPLVDYLRRKFVAVSRAGPLEVRVRRAPAEGPANPPRAP